MLDCSTHLKWNDFERANCKIISMGARFMMDMLGEQNLYSSRRWEDRAVVDLEFHMCLGRFISTSPNMEASSNFWTSGAIDLCFIGILMISCNFDYFIINGQRANEAEHNHCWGSRLSLQEYYSTIGLLGSLMSKITPKHTNSNTESQNTFPRFSAHKLLKVPTCKKNKDVAHSSNQTFKRILG